MIDSILCLFFVMSILSIWIVGYLIHSDLMTIWRLIASIKEKMNESKDEESIKE
jgi:hypothetical protein